jgi:hypothetical protein
MDNTERVLVVILASALAVFLVLAIVIAIKVIQILNKAQKIAEQAEVIADKASTAASMLKSAAGPLAILKIFTGIGEAVFHKTRAKKRGRNAKA